MGWADLELSLRIDPNMGSTHPELGLRIWFLGPAWKLVTNEAKYMCPWTLLLM